MNFSKKILLFALSLWLVVSCSTDKNKWLNRAYHSTTAHYNGYWNAKEAIKLQLKSFRESYQHNYDSILPLYILPNESEAKSMYAIMDTSIAKCATVIKRHSMPEKKTGKNKGEEWNKWIDDNWMIIGQAEFYKHKFKKALEAFKYIVATYPEDENYHWARLWIAKTHIENESFNEANRILLQLQREIDEQIEENKKRKKAKVKGFSTRKAKRYVPPGAEEIEYAEFSKKFIREKKLVEAHLYLSQANYGKAIPAIKESLELVRKRQTKARLYFILGQLYKETNNLPAAGEAFKLVENLHPNYEMTFYAQINQVFVFSGNNSDEIKRKLIKLSKDQKNVDYFDIIYYALADLELKEGNEEKGIEYLKKSLVNNINNQKQKIKSYLRLADLYYSNKDYAPAQAYYDSTLSVVDENYTRYFEIERLNKSLSKLVVSLNEIAYQDSLRDLAENYTEKEIIKKIEKMITEKKREEEERNRQAQQMLNTMGNNNQGVINPNANSGVFWAYDDQRRIQGYNDFKLLWGTRKNEDHWRRKDKSQASFDPSEQEVDTAAEKPEYTVEFYLKTIPFSNEQKRISDSILAEAYYTAGTVFKQDLNEIPSAEKMFSKMNANYKTHELSPAGHYQAYLIAQEQNNKAEAERLKNIILNAYSDSEYAKILRDPDYLKDKENKAKNDELAYKELYENYEKQAYDTVLDLANLLFEQQDTSNLYYCQSMYLRANSIGYLLDDKSENKAFEDALQHVVDVCPDTEVAEKAQNTLNYLRKLNTEQITTIGGSNYTFNAGEQHFFVYVYERGEGRVMDVKTALSDFTTSSFSGKKLSVNSAVYSMTKQLVMVGSFKNLEDAKDFHDAFKTNKDVVANFNKSDNYFIISQKNYMTLYKNKDLDAYKVFYQKNYR